MKSVCFYAVLLASACSACQFVGRGDSDELLAKVGDRSLYESDLAQIYPQNITASDSIALQTNYVQTWVKKQVMIKLAEDNLTEKQKDVTRQLEDYRNSLLIYEYEQAYITQRLEPNISDKECADFYNQNKQNFTLREPIVKVLFIKLRRSTPHLGRIVDIYTSNDAEELSELEKLCLQVAVKYDFFNEQWLRLSQLQQELPPGRNYEAIVANSRKIEVKDDTYIYLVAIKRYMARGEFSPPEYEEENIRSLILNNRKLNLIKKLEDNAVTEATQSGSAVIY